MEYKRTGVILCTENYAECVEFYSNTMELEVLKSLDTEHSKLTVLGFGGETYLMIETGGTSVPTGKELHQNPVWLRFNVSNVDQVAQELIAKGVDVNIRKEVWGTVGDFTDPDGNMCSLREEADSGSMF